MRLRSNSNTENLNVHLVNADTRSLPCALCPASNMERFPNMRGLLEHFTNDHMAIHLYGCHLCNQASTSYADFVMHSCFEGKEEFMTAEPKFSHCFALLLCADCGLQFSLNAGVVNDQAVHEYLSLMAVHNSNSMRLVCIYSVAQLKKDQNHFCVPYNSRMARNQFLSKSDAELQKCCPKLCPRYFQSDTVGLATFARSTSQSECLELININSRIKNVSIEDVLSPVIRTERKIRSAMTDVLQPNKIKKCGLPNSLHADENNIVDGCQKPKNHIKLYVFSYDTCVPRDILQGFLFEKDIYECSGCFTFFDNLGTLEEHNKQCRKTETLPSNFDPLNPRCSRVVFNQHQHPSSRVFCPKCPKTTFCSFVGLRLHYAQDHSIFVNDDHTKISNKKTVLTYGWEVVAEELKHPTVVPTEQGPRLSISNVEKLAKMESNDLRWQSKKRRASRGSNVETNDEPMEFEVERNTGNLKRVAFTRFEHKHRTGSTGLEEAISSARSTTERSTTPANSQSETTRRRTNVLELETDSKRDLRSSSRSLRVRVSHSPAAPEDHNSSGGSVDNSQRKRPPSERAKRMEQKKLEKERRENEEAEKEEHEREARRRRKPKLAENEVPESSATIMSTSTSEDPKPTVNVIIDDVHVLKTVNGMPNKQAKKLAESAENVEIIDLSDDSPNDQIEEEKASNRLVSSQSAHPEESFMFCCFFCGQDIKNTTDFVQHMARHSEQIQRCPLCLVFSRKEQQFKHVLHVIDHIIERHIRMDNNNCVCPHCKINFGPIQDLEPLYLCFQHVLFLCEKSDYCMLCLGTNKVTRFKNNESKREHQREWHPVIYNRFICSKCMSGFPSKFALLDHSCQFTHRCACNQVKPFSTKQTFIDHVRNATDIDAHSLVKPLNGPLGIYFPGSYRKQLKAMEIEILKGSKLVCPERIECLLFFNKYPHLVVPFKPFSSRIKSLHVIKDFSENDHLHLNQADFPPILTKNRKRIAGDEKTEQGGQKRARKFKRKQQENPEEQATKKFKYEQASCERSDVWRLVETYEDDKTMNEVADVLEDLVLSVCDPSTLYANGMTKSTKRQTNYIAPRILPTAQDLILLPLLPSQPPVLFREVQDGPFLEDSSLIDTPPPFLYSIRDKQPDIVPSPQTVSPPIEDEEDDEIEVIGEIKSQSSYLPVVQQPQRKVIYVQRQGQRIVNVDSGAPQLMPERSFSPMLMQRQNAQKSTVPDWLRYTD